MHLLVSVFALDPTEGTDSQSQRTFHPSTLELVLTSWILAFAFVLWSWVQYVGFHLNLTKGLIIRKCYYFRSCHLPKKSFRRVLFSIKYLSGTPWISIIQASCSCSFSPGKRGYPNERIHLVHFILFAFSPLCSLPVCSSAKMHPTLHISIAILYSIPRITSGER